VHVELHKDRNALCSLGLRLSSSGVKILGLNHSIDLPMKVGSDVHMLFDHSVLKIETHRTLYDGNDLSALEVATNRPGYFRARMSAISSIDSPEPIGHRSPDAPRKKQRTERFLEDSSDTLSQTSDNMTSSQSSIEWDGCYFSTSWSNRIFLAFDDTIGPLNCKPSDFDEDYHVLCPGDLLKTTDGSIFFVEGVVQEGLNSNCPLRGHFLPDQEHHAVPTAGDFLCLERSTRVRRVFLIGTSFILADKPWQNLGFFRFKWKRF